LKAWILIPKVLSIQIRKVEEPKPPPYQLFHRWPRLFFIIMLSVHIDVSSGEQRTASDGLSISSYCSVLLVFDNCCDKTGARFTKLLTSYLDDFFENTGNNIVIHKITI
jgi:hypothetical protein